MLLATTGVVFIALLCLSLPIVFALGVAAIVGLLLGGFPLQMLASSVVSGSQSWVLLAIPSFIFAGAIMERCGMSNALVELARAIVGWLRGGLGMSVIVVSYFFSDLCGSKIAEVSALSSALMPSLRRAGYRPEDSASLLASGTAMGMLVPPAIFMIVIAAVTNTSAVALFLAGFVPAATIGVCLCGLVFIQAHVKGWPKDTAPSWTRLLHALRHAVIPLIVPIIILVGFYTGAFTATVLSLLPPDVAATTVATVATNTVTWNGAIAANGSVTITIQATIKPNVPVGTTITNQATFAFDADSNGTNESSGVSDDPGAPGSANPTSLVVAAVVDIPTLDNLGLILLAMLLALGGARVMRRRRA